MRSVFDQVRNRLVSIYESIAIGDPLEEKTLVGPLIDEDAVEAMQAALRWQDRRAGLLSAAVTYWKTWKGTM
jgi:aldehyde dehydrogenase (NAD+)